jgi:hypothetical protein
MIVTVQGTFDIALARNTLRTKIAQQRWPTIFNAHASTALTALGELIILADRTHPVPITIEMLEQSDKGGIKLSSHFRIPDRRPVQWEDQKRNLEQAAADARIQESGNEIEITAYVWIK